MNAREGMRRNSGLLRKKGNFEFIVTSFKLQFLLAKWIYNFGI
jgi:hypothetical protein